MDTFPEAYKFIYNLALLICLPAWLSRRKLENQDEAHSSTQNSTQIQTQARTQDCGTLKQHHDAL